MDWSALKGNLVSVQIGKEHLRDSFNVYSIHSLSEACAGELLSVVTMCHVDCRRQPNRRRPKPKMEAPRLRFVSSMRKSLHHKYYIT